MRVDIPLEIDLGPLAWIKDEVTQSLGRARKGVEELLHAPEDRHAVTQRALDELHQTSGAFELVGIEGLAIYTKEIERHLRSALDSPDEGDVKEVMPTLERALRRLSSHLEEVFSGAPCKPTMLAREYAAMHKARGVDAGAADLFFPDLNRKPAKLEGASPIPADRLPAYLQVARRGYERGLLIWLRGDATGLSAMWDQIHCIERAYPLPSQRSFWWSVAALLRAVDEQSIATSLAVKQLAGRIDLQIRRFVEGSTMVSDRLRREVLFHIGRAHSKIPEVRAVQALYELDRLLPTPGISLKSSVDYVSLRPAIEAVSAAVHDIRGLWQRVASGHTEARESLRTRCDEAVTAAQALQRPGLSRLLKVIHEVSPKTPTAAVGDALAVEYSAALLFVETALANFAGDVASYEKEAASLAEQLQVASSGLSDDTLGNQKPAITRRAQERESYKALIAEVTENLGFVETNVDAWVRGTGSLEVLALHAKLAQVAGVFAISSQQRAMERVRSLDELVGGLDASQPASAQDASVMKIADALSRLGFYVDGKRRQPDADLDHLLSDKPTIDTASLQADEAPVKTEASVEIDVGIQRKQLSTLVSQWQANPTDSGTRERVEHSLMRLLDDAKLLGHSDLILATRDALARVQASDVDHQAETAKALTESIVTGDAMPAPEISSQTQALLTKDEPALDDALVEIFLEEADDILASLDASCQTVRADPREREAIVSIRRSFHTFKGSGRMVGLKALGDAAWDVERFLNARMQSETALTASEISLLDVARREFHRWIAEIRSNPVNAPLQRSALDDALRMVGAEISTSPSNIAGGDVASPSHAVSPPTVAALKKNDEPTSIALGAGALAVAATSFFAIDAHAKPMPEAVKFDASEKIESEVSIASPPNNIESELDISALELTFDPGKPSNVTSDVEPIPPLASDHAIDFLPEVNALNAQAPSDAFDFDFSKTLSVDPNPATIAMFDAFPSDVPDTIAEAKAAHAMSDELDAATLQSTVPQPNVEQPTAPSSFDITPVAVVASASAAALTASAVTEQTSPANQFRLPDALHAIVTDEALTHLTALTNEVERMQFEPAMRPTDEMIRAAHTLKGMHLSVGLDDIGRLAGSLEAALIATKRRSSNEDALPAVATAVAALQSLCQCVRDRIDPDPADLDFAEIASESLKQLYDATDAQSADELIHQSAGGAATTVTIPPEFKQSMLLDDATINPVTGLPLDGATPSVSTPFVVAASVAAATVAASTAHSSQALQETTPVLSPPLADEKPTAQIEASFLNLEKSKAATDEANVPVASAPSAASDVASKPVAASMLQVPRSDPLADVRDDLEPAVLPIFLEEAQELFPQASAQLRQWRAMPDDTAASNSLKRTMHTIKGSARMAGAMRLGELAHRLESRLEDADHGAALSAAAFDEVESDLDGIAFLLDRLQHGEANTPLPGFEAQSASAGSAMMVAEPVDLPVNATVESIAATGSTTPTSDESEYASLPRVEEIALPVAAIAAAALVTTTELKPVSPNIASTQRAADPNEALRWLESENASQAQVLRVRADSIERLADETGEISISRSRMESELGVLRGNLTELTSSVQRLRAQVREIEIQAETQIQSRMSQVTDSETGFDPLEFDRFTRFQELTRSLAEGVNDVSTVQQSIVSNLDTTEIALNAQGRIARSLQGQLQSIRTVAFSSLRERLYRVLRQTARETNKRANLEIRSGDTSLDRSVLERLAPLVEHILRNALAHGIESPDARTASGKSETGEISIELRQQGNMVEVVIADDGAGFNLDAIRAKAHAQNLLGENESSTDSQLIDLIFAPGFTTASEVSSVAGRGVGMDVVRTELNALGGRVEAIHTPGKGARFVLQVPLTLTVLNAVIVQIGASRYGVPASMVETVKSLRASEIDTARASGVVQHGKSTIAFAALHGALGEVLAQRDETANKALVVHAGERVIALDVDAILGNQEVVLKRMGPQLMRVPGLLGVTLMGNGDIVLLYNPIALFDVRHAVAPLPAAQFAAPLPVTDLKPVADTAPSSGQAIIPSQELRVSNVVPIRPQAKIKPEKPLIMVVDDSLTVRKITTRFLEREGFRAISAKDGMEALTMLSDHRPAVILLDIEMPRMDGFEFTRAAKGDEKLREIPIIMITSRSAEKHRNHAKELGVNAYLGKPYQEEELLRNINVFVQQSVEPAPV